MNRFFAVCAVAGGLLLTGCEDRLPIESPETPAGHQLAVSSPSKASMTEIPIWALVNYPPPSFNELILVSGSLFFSLERSDPYDDVADRNATEVDIFTSVTLTPYPSEDPRWTIESASTQMLSISPEGVVQLYKRYRVPGWTNGLMLNLELQVTTDNIEVTAVWLSLPDVVANGS